MAPAACPCCGGALRKIGEDVSETLDLVPRQWNVIQHVREKFSCRSCESITQPPASSHPIARGRAGAGLLAMCCSLNAACICRLTGSVPPMPAKVSTLDIPDARRLGGRIRSDPDAADRGDPRPCICGRAHSCRQHDGAGARKGQYTDRPAMHGTARQLGGPDTGQPSPHYLWINRAIKPSVSPHHRGRRGGGAGCGSGIS